jgi:hypothetical protein
MTDFPRLNRPACPCVQHRDDKRALYLVYVFLGVYALQFVVSIAFGAWFFYAKPNEALSSRIIGGLLVTMATFFVFDSLGRIFGFLAATPLQSTRLVNPI